MEILDVLGLGGVDISRDVEVEVILRVGDLGQLAPSASSEAISSCLLKTSTILWMS